MRILNEGNPQNGDDTAFHGDRGTVALRSVPFHGDEIITFEADGRPHVAMRRIVENMGLAWPAQSTKLNDQRAKFSCSDIATTAADGKAYAMLCMPVAKLPLWLATINPNKVKDTTIRAKVEEYQAESAIALHDYWTKGSASRSDIHERTNGIARQMNGKVARLERTVFDLTKLVTDLVITADPRRAALDYVSVRQMLDEAKAVSKKRNSLNRRFGHDLRRRALIEATDGAPPARKCPHSGVWLYQRDFAIRYMKERGYEMVADHNSVQTGQTVIRFPDRRVSSADHPSA